MTRSSSVVFDTLTEPTNSFSSKRFAISCCFSFATFSSASKITVVGASAPLLNLSSNMSYPTLEGISSGKDFIVLYSYVIVKTLLDDMTRNSRITATDKIGFLEMNFPTLLQREDARASSSPALGSLGQQALLPSKVNRAGISVTDENIATRTA